MQITFFLRSYFYADHSAYTAAYATLPFCHFIFIQTVRGTTSRMSSRYRKSGGYDLAEIVLLRIIHDRTMILVFFQDEVSCGPQNSIKG